MVCKTVNRGIAEYLRANGLTNVTELVGTLRTGRDIQDTPVSG
jgi:hypothetical protein